MSDHNTLGPGDASFASNFKKVTRSDCGASYEAGFKPPKGREFVVLLLGDAPKGSAWVDVEKMLNDLGFFRKDEQP